MNGKLFRALLRVFGQVRTSKEGEGARWIIQENPDTGRKHARLVEAGEEYKVCCPFCGDMRFRLNINHRWNTTDEATGAHFGKGLICCFNDGCPANPDAPVVERQGCQDDLEEMLKPYVARAMGLRLPRECVARPVIPMSLPEDCVPLETLPPGHHAIRYLAGRGFDPYAIGREWLVQYCPSDANGCVADRIIFPLVLGGKLLGWQARYIGTPPSDNIPRYFTAPGTPRNRLLYNYDRARDFPFAVLVEGPTDAWRLGRRAVALLGSTMSHHQIALAREAWGATGIALMLDQDFAAKPALRPGRQAPYGVLCERLISEGRFAWGVLEVPLPPGTDPGAMDTGALWDLIRRRAIETGYGHPVG